jgi:hypothetical protein
VLKRYGIEIEKQRIISYDNFVNMIAGKGADGRKLLDQQLEGSPNGDMGYRTLFVFDEAHNLISPGLPADERVVLDAEFDHAEIAGRVLRKRADVYGELDKNGDGVLRGRDLVAAMLWESYAKSKKDSAKCLILTGTPMSTSPSELFWLLNLTIESKPLRLSLDVSDYYDSSAMKMRDEAVLKFARAAHGRISYLDITQNPTTFARKVFFDRFDVPLHKFHENIIDDAVKKQKDAGVDWSEIVASYQNLSLIARTKGAFFSTETLKKFQEAASAEDRQAYQAERYLRDRENAAKAFKLQVSDKDRAAYEKKAEQYRKWGGFSDVLDRQGNLLTLEEWMTTAEAIPVIPAGAIPAPVRKRYETLLKRKAAYDEKLSQNKKVKSPKLDELLRVDGTVKSLEEFFSHVWVSEHMKKRDAGEYAKLVDAYKDFRSDNRQRHVPVQVEQVMDRFGRLLSVDEWFLRKQKPAKKNYSKEQLKYKDFLIQDPESGYMRIRTSEEFVQIAERNELDGKEDRKGVSLLMWHKNFAPDVSRELIPVYAPRIHACIENIVAREKQAVLELGHGLKHTVFTFSTAGKGIAGGSRVVASAFHGYQDMFRVLLVYKENDEGKFVLHHDLPSTGLDDHRWGVAVLSSKSIPNIYLDQYGGNQTVEYNFKVIGATQAAFNDAKNRYGDRIKVLIMDGAYTEGVEAYDDSIGHFLNEGLSASQLEQASSRSVRYCRSKNIPFYKGVGGFMEMYFYAQQGLNERMLEHVPYTEQLNINLMDVFKELSAQFSIDYWLNINVNDFRPVYQGRITDYYSKWNRAYIVTKALEISERNEASSNIRDVDYKFTVDPESVLTVIKVGSLITDPLGLPGRVLAWKGNVRKFEIEYTTTSERALFEVHDLRLSIGEEIEFHIPYGTTLAKKVMNIGNYNVMQPPNTVPDMVTDIKTPIDAVRVVSTAFQNNNTIHTLLGIFSMLRLVHGTGYVGQIHISLPSVTEYADDWDYWLPNVSEYACEWTFKNGQRFFKRPLQSGYSNNPFKEFLSVKQGISIMFLVLRRSQDSENTSRANDHVNLLVYTPAWGTVERFDPFGYVAHMYDVVTLDATLYDLFQSVNPELRYMSTVETSVLRTKKQKMDSDSYSTAFALFYMHCRILHTTDKLLSSNEKREVYPLQFQRGLMSAMRGFDLGDYMRSYAELAINSRKLILAWSEYDDQRPFWANLVLACKGLMREIKSERRENRESPEITKSTKSTKPQRTFFEALRDFIPTIGIL